LRNLGGDTPENREIAILITNKGMELDKAQSELEARSDRYIISLKRLIPRPPPAYDGKLETE
jgi:hypothetical protein